MKNPAPGNTKMISARDYIQSAVPTLPLCPENVQGKGEDKQNAGDLTCLIKVIETMSQETMPWSMSSKKAVRVNASISL